MVACLGREWLFSSLLGFGSVGGPAFFSKLLERSTGFLCTGGDNPSLLPFGGVKVSDCCDDGSRPVSWLPLLLSSHFLVTGGVSVVVHGDAGLCVTVGSSLALGVGDGASDLWAKTGDL